MFILAMPLSAINCKRLVSKCAETFGRMLMYLKKLRTIVYEDELKQQQISLNVHLVGPARGTSQRMMPAQLLNRRRISSSSTYISSDLQEELLTGSCQHSYWTDGGSRLHPHTSHRTYKRNFKQTIPAQLLNRWKISFSSIYIMPDLQEELLTGSCQRSYGTDGGSHHPYPRNGLLDNFLSFMNHDFE